MKRQHLLIALFVTYLTLLFGTGYLAFLRPDKVASTDADQLGKLKDAELNEADRKIYIDGLNQLTENHRKRQELGFQSFNVVLGAVLGFLSAISALALKGREDPPAP